MPLPIESVVVRLNFSKHLCESSLIARRLAGMIERLQRDEINMFLKGLSLMRFCESAKLVLVATYLVASCQQLTAAEWKPGHGPLMTRWAKDVSPENVRPEYPRPQMRRATWQNLNGLWDYAIRPADEPQPNSMDGEILVPFPVESALSGVMKSVGEQNRLWYRKRFSVPHEWAGNRVLLHFGAVDWATTAWLNGKPLGEHKGGYDPFSFDLTPLLNADGEQELVLSVWDPNDASYQPRGKQVNRPGGIFYTPTTGIWQTVWLEPVPKTFIRSLKVTPDVANKQVRVEVDVPGLESGDEVQVSFSGKDGGGAAKGIGKDTLTLPVPDARLWSPEDPFLYDLKVTLSRGGKPIDTANSYFAMREISLGKDAAGITRLMLNGKPVFHWGPLDQGFWPDGLYTAPTHEAMVYDIEITKQLGFNMIRKHVKVEPATWYHECDKRGMLVWQDMPSGDRSINPDQPDIQRSPESAAQYEAEWQIIIAANYHFPSIVMWVPFNEGWGQFDTARIVEMTKRLDPTRLVNCASGWADRGVGDVHDAHIYAGPGMFPVGSDRASVLGEFGGLGLPLEGHTWQGKDNWGYKSFTSKAELATAYRQLIHRLRPLIGKGLCAAVYTQTTDVEVEVNGLLTYDREVLKIPADDLAKLHAKVLLPPPDVVTLVPTSQETAQEWRYTTSEPSDNWYHRDFSTDGWSTAPGGMGTRETPGTVVRTEWNSPQIWIRRDFELNSQPQGEPLLLIHHDEDATVYINGVLAAELTGYTTQYEFVEIRPEARATLKQGRNTVAVHCRQTRGGQYIDLGLVDVVEK